MSDAEKVAYVIGARSASLVMKSAKSDAEALALLQAPPKRCCYCDAPAGKAHDRACAINGSV